MRRVSLFSICLVWACLSGLLHADAQHSCASVSLPEKIESLGEPLVLNGMGLRSATFLKVHVYVGGLYLARPSRDSAEILRASRSKQLTMHFVRHVSRKDITDAIRDGLRGIPNIDMKAAQSHVESMARYLTDLPNGTVLKLAYKPKQGLHVFANDKAIGVEHDDTFANLLFRVWLGENPPDDDLKRGLLGGRCS